jgi:hypothetical protein
MDRSLQRRVAAAKIHLRLSDSATHVSRIAAYMSERRQPAMAHRTPRLTGELAAASSWAQLIRMQSSVSRCNRPEVASFVQDRWFQNSTWSRNSRRIVPSGAPQMGVQGHMWHGLDFVNLQNPQVRRPPVRLEQGS